MIRTIKVLTHNFQSVDRLLINNYFKYITLQRCRVDAKKFCQSCVVLYTWLTMQKVYFVCSAVMSSNAKLCFENIYLYASHRARIKPEIFFKVRLEPSPDPARFTTLLYITKLLLATKKKTKHYAS